MRTPAFNVSVGFDITCVMNSEQAELLTNLILDLADHPEALELMSIAFDGYDDPNSTVGGKLPPSVFAFAKQLEKQLKASKSFKQSGRKNKIVKKSAEVA